MNICLYVIGSFMVYTNAIFLMTEGGKGGRGREREKEREGGREGIVAADHADAG